MSTFRLYKCTKSPIFFILYRENSHQDTKTQSNTKGFIINESFVPLCLCGNHFHRLRVRQRSHEELLGPLIYCVVKTYNF